MCEYIKIILVIPEFQQVLSVCELQDHCGLSGTLQSILIQRNRNVCDKTAYLVRCWQTGQTRRSQHFVQLN